MKTYSCVDWRKDVCQKCKTRFRDVWGAGQPGVKPPPDTHFQGGPNSATQKGAFLAELFSSSACARRGVELGSYLWYTYIVDIPYMCIHWISFLLGCRPVGQKLGFLPSGESVPLGGGGIVSNLGPWG